MADKLQEILDVVGKHVNDVPALKQYITDNINQASTIVANLAKVNSGQSFSAWKASALAAVQAAGVKGQSEWQEYLINFAYETVKGEASRFFLLRWFSKAKDFITRAGLGSFLSLAIRPAIDYFEAQIALPGASFESVGSSTFNFLKSQVPNSKDTWIALAVNIVKIAIKSRIG